MKTVLVTGSRGQLGKSILDIVKKHSQYHFIFTNQPQVDVTNYKSIKSIFDKNKIDWCINCAAYTKVDLAESEPEIAFLINEEGSKNLANICKENNTKLIHISTDFVFDGASKTPYLESSITNPINTYGLSKLQGELEIEKALKEYYIIRTSWLYSEYGKNFLRTMLRLSKNNNELKVVNDQNGSPTYAGDLAEVILKIIEDDSENYGLYNYSNKGQTTWYGFAKEIFQLTGGNTQVKPIDSEEYRTAAKRPQYSVLNCDKIEEAYKLEIPNWKTSLKKAITKLYE
ncbi:dTDP-4-dehydrorhamnose reductase [Hanstruepera ponticola]|uniref:dTDP-4-dehydrorhamnose reductase n=1 Tax=Hanstruepera ponticola TaxID=2042995 RepID=UPI0017849491|nr:dTDP-4-dehydrorhamnose reductase [Hanstruepera ponticola]